MRGFFRGALRKLALFMGLLVFVLIVVPLVKGRLTSEKERLCEIVRSMGKAAEQHDVGGIVRYIRIDYSDIWRNRDRNLLETSLRKVFDEYPVIEIELINPRPVEFDKAAGSAKVYFTAVIRGGKKKGVKADEDLNAALGGKDFGMIFQKNADGRWQVTLASRLGKRK